MTLDGEPLRMRDGVRQRLEGEGWCHCSSVLGSDPIREALGWAWPGGSLRRGL